MTGTGRDVRAGLLEAIGRTPLIRLRKASELTGCEIYGKAEFMNPGGSVKDRAALAIIQDALAKGKIEPGGTIVEGTAGNTGIGLALVGNALGLKSVIVIPDTQSQEKKDTLRMCGADLREVPAVPYKDPNNYVKVSGRLAEELNATEPHGAFWANQFDNVANREGHYRTTGPEIWEQTGGKVDAFICALGTGGTLAMVASTLIALGLFMALPQALATFTGRLFGLELGLADPLFHVLVGGYKLLVFLGYLLSVSQMNDMRRVFEYHGAEHLVVSGHEARKVLRPEVLRGGPIRHPRCGTSFLLVVAAIAAVVHPFLPHGSLVLQLGGRILAVPLIVAVSYEVLTALGRVAALRPGSRLDRVLLWPQRFTTRRPDDDQVEVAIAALQGALGPVSVSPTGPGVLSASLS